MPPSEPDDYGPGEIELDDGRVIEHDGYITDYSYSSEPLGALEVIRVTVGWALRLAAMATLSFIYFNAIAQAIADKEWLLFIGEVIIWPLVPFLYPFLAPEGHFAWPFADGTSFVPALVVMVVTWIGSAFLLDD